MMRNHRCLLGEYREDIAQSGLIWTNVGLEPPTTELALCNRLVYKPTTLPRKLMAPNQWFWCFNRADIPLSGEQERDEWSLVFWCRFSKIASDGYIDRAARPTVVLLVQPYADEKKPDKTDSFAVLKNLIMRKWNTEARVKTIVKGWSHC